MRQAGMLAAAGLKKVGFEVDGPHTNMVMVKVEQPRELADHLKKRGILVLPRGPMRLVTHLDVDAAGIDRAIWAFGEFLAGSIRGARRPLLRSASSRAMPRGEASRLPRLDGPGS